MVRTYVPAESSGRISRKTVNPEKRSADRAKIKNTFETLKNNLQVAGTASFQTCHRETKIIIFFLKCIMENHQHRLLPPSLPPPAIVIRQQTTLKFTNPQRDIDTRNSHSLQARQILHGE